jgi:hypothetical protein
VPGYRLQLVASSVASQFRLSPDVCCACLGGFADAAAQDAFCADTTCLITILYDQSPQANHLTVGPRGGLAPWTSKPMRRPSPCRSAAIRSTRSTCRRAPATETTPRQNPTGWNQSPEQAASDEQHAFDYDDRSFVRQSVELNLEVLF